MHVGSPKNPLSLKPVKNLPTWYYEKYRKKWEELYRLLIIGVLKFANLPIYQDVWNFHQNRLSILKPLIFLITYINFKSFTLWVLNINKVTTNRHFQYFHCPRYLSKLSSLFTRESWTLFFFYLQPPTLFMLRKKQDLDVTLEAL